MRWWSWRLVAPALYHYLRSGPRFCPPGRSLWLAAAYKPMSAGNRGPATRWIVNRGLPTAGRCLCYCWRLPGDAGGVQCLPTATPLTSTRSAGVGRTTPVEAEHTAVIRGCAAIVVRIPNVRVAVPAGSCTWRTECADRSPWPTISAVPSWQLEIASPTVSSLDALRAAFGGSFLFMRTALDLPAPAWPSSGSRSAPLILAAGGPCARRDWKRLRSASSPVTVSLSPCRESSPRPGRSSSATTPMDGSWSRGLDAPVAGGRRSSPSPSVRGRRRHRTTGPHRPGRLDRRGVGDDRRGVLRHRGSRSSGGMSGHEPLDSPRPAAAG
jgi:hypothetical protein